MRRGHSRLTSPPRQPCAHHVRLQKPRAMHCDSNFCKLCRKPVMQSSVRATCSERKSLLLSNSGCEVP